MKTAYKIGIIILPIILISSVILLKPLIYRLTEFFPVCPFYSIFHLYCPACGNTRSVLALLQGDILASLKYNATPLLLIVAGGAGYAELITLVFNRHKKILPRSNIFLFSLVGLLLIYYIVRNFFA